MAESGVDLSYDETFQGNGSFKPSPKRQMQSSVTKRYSHNMRYRQKMMLLKQQAEDEEFRKLQERKAADDDGTCDAPRKKSGADVVFSSVSNEVSAGPGRGGQRSVQLLKNVPTTAPPWTKYRIVGSFPQLSHLGSSLVSNESDSVMNFVGRASDVSGPVTFTLSSSEPVAETCTFVGGFAADFADIDVNSQLSETTNSASEVSELQSLVAGCVDLETAEDLDLNEIYPTVVSDFSQLLHASESFTDRGNDVNNEFVWSDKKGKSSTSSSCPSDYNQQTSYKGGRKKDPPPDYMSEEQFEIWEKERQRKDNHNEIEKKRRYKINDHIQELADLLPNNYDIDLQNKKGKILEASVDYIRQLKRDQERMNRVKEKQAQLEKQNRSLRLQLQTLQLSAHLSPPTQQQQQQQEQYEHHQLVHLVDPQQQQPVEQQQHQLADYILLDRHDDDAELETTFGEQRLAVVPVDDIDEVLMKAVFAGMDCDDDDVSPPLQQQQRTDENPMDVVNLIDCNLIDYDDNHLIGDDPFIGEGSLTTDFLSMFR